MALWSSTKTPALRNEISAFIGYY